MSLSAAEARTIAINAYIYAVPMVAQYKTMFAYSIDRADGSTWALSTPSSTSPASSPRRHRLRHA